MAALLIPPLTQIVGFLPGQVLSEAGSAPPLPQQSAALPSCFNHYAAKKKLLKKSKTLHCGTLKQSAALLACKARGRQKALAAV